jgi:hypothetical protein
MKSQGEERSRNIEDEMMMKRDNGEGFKDPRLPSYRSQVSKSQVTGHKKLIAM